MHDIFRFEAQRIPQKQRTWVLWVKYVCQTWEIHCIDGVLANDLWPLALGEKTTWYMSDDEIHEDTEQEGSVWIVVYGQS